MWRNYLLVAVRRLAGQRSYALVTIGGLALGLAGCLLILGYVRYERSYDAWQPGADRVFQVQSTIHPPGQPEVTTQASSFPIYEQIRAGFLQIEAVTSVSLGKTVAERDGRPAFIEATTVDPDFFRVFDLPFAQGSAATALPDGNSIVLTESEAVRWFGRADVLGRTLTLGAGEGKRGHRVTGVLRDLPRNTVLKVGLIFRRDLGVNGRPPAMRGWGSFDQLHYIRLRPGTDAAAIEAGLPAWEARSIATEQIGGQMMAMADAVDFRLQPLRDVHLGAIQYGAAKPGGDARSLATFAIVAALTLVMAIINFANLSTARAVARGREIALRKALGATRGRLAAQFLAESLLVTAAAMLVALAIVELATPWIGALLAVELPVAYLGEGGMLLPALVLLVGVGVAGGIYPALYADRLRAAPALQGNRGSAATLGSGRVRAGLVVVQFAIAIGLIASTAVIYSQTRFVDRIDPGYQRDGLIQIANAWRFTQGTEFEAARPLMLQLPGVTAVGRTALALDPTDKTMRLMRRPGAAEYAAMGFFGVDAAFLDTMEIRLIVGRRLGDRFARDMFDGLSPAQLSTRGINVMANRAAVARLGFPNPRAAIGQVVQVAFVGWGTEGQTMVPATIVGVVADTRLRTAREAVDPIVYAYEPAQTSTVLVRYAGAAPAAVMAGLERVWRRFEPEIPFEARFADDIGRQFHAADRARSLLFAGFSLLAIVIACLGLYGLAAFTAERRTKEIGIRKVLGARTRDIVRLLVWQFTRPVVIANLLAWPIAWWAMRDWLNGFGARIELTPAPFLLAGGLALAIAIVTVAGHAWRVARETPARALRYE